MCNIGFRNAGVKQDDIARVLNVSQSVVSTPLKKHRESGSIRKRKRSTLIMQGIATEALWYVVHYLMTT